MESIEYYGTYRTYTRPYSYIHMHIHMHDTWSACAKKKSTLYDVCEKSALCDKSALWIGNLFYIPSIYIQH